MSSLKKPQYIVMPKSSGYMLDAGFFMPRGLLVKKEIPNQIFFRFLADNFSSASPEVEFGVKGASPSSLAALPSSYETDRSENEYYR